MTIMAIYTALHVVISLVAIVAGFIAMTGWSRQREVEIATAIFLFMTTLTSLTGFGFPASHFTPAHLLGVISLIALAVALFAKYARGLAHGWAFVFLMTATLAQYLNVFVLVIQSFQKLSPLRALAPTQSEPSFLLVQITVLAGFVYFVLRVIVLILRRGKELSNANVQHGKFQAEYDTGVGDTHFK